MKASHVCGHCGSEFKREFDLSIHVNNCKHKAKKITCSRCTKKFTTQRNMERHRDTSCVGMAVEGDAIKGLIRRLDALEAEIKALRAENEEFSAEIIELREKIDGISNGEETTAALEKVDTDDCVKIIIPSKYMHLIEYS